MLSGDAADRGTQVIPSPRVDRRPVLDETPHSSRLGSRQRHTCDQGGGMDNDLLRHIYSDVLAGVSKANSRYVTDTESSQVWDRLAAEVDAAKTANSGVVFDLPFD